MTENQTPKAPTAAQIRTNHERARKAAEKLTGNGRHVRVTALCPSLADPAVLVLERRPMSSRRDEDFEETARVSTTVDQKIGVPVNYSNQYSEANRGSMCFALDRAEKARQRKFDGLRQMEREVRRLREELAQAEARVAARKEELGLSDNLDEIAAELSNKFTGPVYTANAVLESRTEDGNMVWLIEYTLRATGERATSFDGRIRRTPNGVTCAL